MMFSPILTLYGGAVAALGPFASLWLDARTKQGKEDPARVSERFGHAPRARPAGTLVWLHAASVGESGVALQLIEGLAARDGQLSFLISTGTRTSAELIARRAPARTIHVYAPLDQPGAARRFMRHWRPNLGVFVESEVWPNLLREAKREGVRLALANARMSPTTINRWRRWRQAARRVFGAFDVILAADQRTAAGLSEFTGRAISSPGNLKLAAPPPKVDAALRAALAAEIGARPAWLAASTHEGEDALLLEAHALLRKHVPDALLIIAPRHPERGEAVAKLANDAPRRAQSSAIGDAPIYIADTMGELALFYSLAPVAFVGGSLLPHLKGHNAAEPARLGAAIVAGPYVESFEELYADLAARNAYEIAQNAAQVADAVRRLLTTTPLRAKRCEDARAAVTRNEAALPETLNQLAALLPAIAPRMADARA